MSKLRLDSLAAKKGIFNSKSAAAKYISLGFIKINGRVINDPGTIVDSTVEIENIKSKTYVSRAGLKLEAANKVLKVDFIGATVLDVGSSTGGFTDYSLKNKAKKVIAVEIGSNQMDLTLAADPRVELMEKTDIRQVKSLAFNPDIVLIDLSFVSLREILPHIYKLIDAKSKIIALVKPQFEANSSAKNKGVIKNQKIRRQILVDLELWFRENKFVVLNKIDSEIHGLKGNIERFYLLKKAKR